MNPPRPTALLRLYSLGATLIAPIALLRVKRKLQSQGIDLQRLSERKGKPTKARPEGQLIWCHAASVGESLSILRLVSYWAEKNAAWSFLITTGTATSAQIIAKRLPPRTIHQFAPLDSRIYVRRFLNHWAPDAAVFVESELWPNMLGEAYRRGIHLALVNARISDRSAKNWKRAVRTSQYLLGLFAHIHCQDQRTEQHLHDIGVKQAKAGQNLKSFSGPLPVDETEYNRMRSVVQGRPVWLASSTHPSEDEIILAAHRQLVRNHTGLLLILVPRHPERADQIELLIAEAGLNGARRSTGTNINGNTQVYLADTLGETGLWYQLCPITCLCGSFVPVGGHNPYEPAYAGSAVLHGPLYANFAETYAQLDESGGAVEVADQDKLAEQISNLLMNPQQLLDIRNHAKAFSEAQGDALAQIAAALSKALRLR